MTLDLEYTRIQAALRLDAARIGLLTGALAASDTPTTVLPPVTTPAPAAVDWTITWTLSDRLLVPLALMLAAVRPRGTHRRGRHTVRRHGITLRGPVGSAR